MHIWDDDWPYWDDLNNAVNYFGKLVRWYALYYHDLKEKYGSLRFYLGPAAFVAPGTRHNWILPYRNKPFYPFGKRVSAWLFRKLYRRAYAKTVKRYPHLAEELLFDADMPEWLAGIVNPATCEHKSCWACHPADGASYKRCGACMTKLPYTQKDEVE